MQTNKTNRKMLGAGDRMREKEPGSLIVFVGGCVWEEPGLCGSEWTLLGKNLFSKAGVLCSPQL